MSNVLGLIAMAAVLTVVAGCAQTPIKMGAAAIVGDERITTKEVHAAANSFRDAQQRLSISPSQVRLPDPQSLPRSVLMLLVQLRVTEEAARSEGITISEAEIDAFIGDQLGGREDLERRAVVSGIPPSHLNAVVREILTRDELAARIAPDEDNPEQAAQQVQDYLAGYARDLGITVSPRYGRFNYESMSIASAADTRLSRPENPTPGTS